jgi:hypothetical protein
LPGANGGGSFGLYLHQSSAVVVGGGLTGGNAGEGGNGGVGGGGGQGGAGGGGAPGDLDSCDTNPPIAKAGDGGDGSTGGTGGAGGGGGGGAGGPSAGLFGTATSNFVTRNTDLQGGVAGTGGPSGGGGGSGDQGQTGGALAAPGANSGAADFDGDGITDPNDDCPANFSNTAANGCPARGAVLADADGDTVPDRDDRCPGQVGATTDGCPVPPANRITAEIRASWRLVRGGTVAKKLVVWGAPKGAKITVRCAGGGASARGSLATRFRKGCPPRGKSYTVRSGRGRNVVSYLNRLTKIRGRRTNVMRKLPPRTRLTVIVTAPGLIGKAVTYTMRARKRPKVTQRCTVPGSVVPQNSC